MKLYSPSIRSFALKNELMIKNDFLSYFNLEALYVYFRDNAHEEKPDDLPFGHLTL